MSWGVQLLGLSRTLDVLDDLRQQWSGDTLYIVGPTVEYAIYQERGTSAIEARPFMAPAAREVQRNTGSHVRRMASAQSVDISSEAGVVKAAALAVQNRAKVIAHRKGVRDTGQLIASIRIEQIQ